MQNILFRADSSSDIGLGHIKRDLVLAKEFKNENVIFASQELKGNINSQIIEAGHGLKILHSNDIQELIALVKEQSINLLVIDNYSLGYKEEKHIKEKTGVKIFVLDDTYEKHYCDILLNHNLGAKAKKYRDITPKFCELRCGPKYTLLRDEFHKEEKKIKEKKKGEIKKVFISMGGTDHSKLNKKILKILNSFKNLEISLVTTTANKNLKELQTYVKHKKNIKLHIDSTHIAKLMRKSNFAIITPSVTANEAYFMRLPFIAIKTADNQQYMYKYLKCHSYLTLKSFHSKRLSLRIKQMLKSLKRSKQKIISEQRTHIYGT